MYNEVWCTCKVVVLLIKPIFLTFSLPSASLDLKVSYIREMLCNGIYGFSPLY